MERAQEILSPFHEQSPDVVRLEEPLVRIDRERVGAFQGGELVRLARRHPGGRAVRRVHVEPQPFAFGEVREAGYVVDRAGVRRAGDRADRERCETCRAVLADGGCDVAGAQLEGLVGGNDLERPLREAEEVDGSLDREVGLIGGIDPGALKPRAAGRLAAEELPQVHVPGDREGHDVRHHAAAGEDPPAVVGVAAEVAEPADDLLLDERARHAREPHVDALVQPLGECLAGDRHRERRRCEVAVGTRMLGCIGERSEALAELGQHFVRGAAARGRGLG